jgi:hypothetical protein
MKLSTIILGIFSLSMLVLCSCEKDNMEGPNARFFGSIKDSLDGSLVETDLINGSSIDAFEQGFESPVLQRWVIMNTGEFRNNLVFANTYNFKLQNGNFFPYDVNGVEIRKGDNQRDFQVVPYLRLRDVLINYDQATKKITATAKIRPGKPGVNLRTVRLYAFSDQYVGEPIKFNIGGSSIQNFTPSKTIEEETVQLTIDAGANANFLVSGREYFFRIGALADISGVGTIRHNYAPVVKIKL